VGLGVGPALGIQLGRDLEKDRDYRLPAGFAAAGLLHLAPEVGYRLDDRLTLGLQTRHQIAPGAHAIFARAHYAWRRLGPAQLFGTATLGAGTAFRLRVPAAAGLERGDAVVGGPVVLGPGVAARHALGERIDLVAELRMLIGLPAVAGSFDLAVGAAYRL
jgi:hypothetical protein